MTAHNENRRTICPQCMKRFQTEHACKTHMKRKGHTLFRYIDEPWAKYAASFTEAIAKGEG